MAKKVVSDVIADPAKVDEVPEEQKESESQISPELAALMAADEKERVDAFRAQLRVWEKARTRNIGNWESGGSGKYAFLIQKPSDEELKMMKDKTHDKIDDLSPERQLALDEKKRTYLASMRWNIITNT